MYLPSHPDLQQTEMSELGDRIGEPCILLCEQCFAPAEVESAKLGCSADDLHKHANCIGGNVRCVVDNEGVQISEAGGVAGEHEMTERLDLGVAFQVNRTREELLHDFLSNSARDITSPQQVCDCAGLQDDPEDIEIESGNILR